MTRSDSLLLDVQGLHTQFHTLDGVARAVNDVSFNLQSGEILGIVGESGSGKSVTSLSIMGLIRPPGKINGGQILFNGTDLLTLPDNKLRDIRGNRISMIFQEPMTSLHPLFNIGTQISEIFIKHRKLSKKDAWNRSIEMLDKVQIPSPEKRVRDYPHHMSGGMRQRVMIAMALACNPRILIADEPTTALDVTIQAQVIDLMLDLRQDNNTAVVMITHDLGVIAEIAENVVVMYAGRIVEKADVFTIFENPRHPYTKALLQSVPKLGNRTEKGRGRLKEIRGIVPNLYDLPRGCAFYPRCSKAREECMGNDIDLAAVKDNVWVRCLFPEP